MSLLQDNYKEFLKDFQLKISKAEAHRVSWERIAYVCDVYFKRSLDSGPATNNKTLGFDTKVEDGAIHIPKIKKITRGLKNMLLKNTPRWNIQAGGMVSAPSKEEIEIAQKILDFYYKKNYIRNGLRDIVSDGFVKSIGWCSVLWDADKDECQITFEAPDNIYTSPDCRLVGPTVEGSYIIRRYIRGIPEIKSNPLYTGGLFANDVSKLQPSHGKLAEMFNRLTGNIVVYTNTDGMCLVEELYFMDNRKMPLDREKVLEGLSAIADGEGGIDALEQEEKTEPKVRVITRVGDTIIRDDFTDYDYFPWFGYKPEHDHSQIYTRPWIADLIPLADAINRAWTNRDTWIKNVARGRLMVKKDVKLSTIRNKNGTDIVQYTGDMPPTEMRTEAMPPAVGEHIAAAESIMEDVGGIHAVSIGQNIGTNYSGSAIGKLQAADLDNVSEPKENLETFFEELAYRILDCESKFGKVRRFSGDDGKELVGIGKLGQDAAAEMGIDIEKAIKLRPFDNIEVDIVPGSAFTDLMAIDNLIKLKELGVKVPDAAVIEAMKIGNARELLNTALEEEGFAQEFADGPDALEVKQAELETMKLLQGMPISAQEGENHEIHMAIHSKALQALDPKDPRGEGLRRHILQHEAVVNPQAQLPGEQEIPTPQAPSAPGMPPGIPPDGTQIVNENVPPPAPGGQPPAL